MSVGQKKLLGMSNERAAAKLCSINRLFKNFITWLMSARSISASNRFQKSLPVNMCPCDFFMTNFGSFAFEKMYVLEFCFVMSLFFSESYLICSMALSCLIPSSCCRCGSS